MARKKSSGNVVTSAYDRARAKMDTGDIVLFSGKGGLSAGIKWFTVSAWSHVGMILKIPNYDLIMLWESTTLSDLADYESGKPTKGVQLVVLSERLRRYKGEVALRHLTAKRTPQMLDALEKFRSDMRGVPYEKKQLELIKAAYDGPFGENKEDLSSVFCSELVAEAYQTMGLLSQKASSNEFTPADFSSDRKKPLKLLAGANLGPEIRLKGD